MVSASANLPDETSILCESCGYTLDGLPDGANCPECGKPASNSLADDGRRACAWELRTTLVTFLSTTLAVILAPSKFFRTMLTRSRDRKAEYFGNLHIVLQSLLFGATAGFHWHWYYREILFKRMDGSQYTVAAVMFGVSMLSFAFINRLAARLTAWEARYRGIRLPLPVVRRAMNYHLASCLPVAGKYYVFAGCQELFCMAGKPFKPTEFILQFWPRGGVAIGQVQAANNQLIYRCLQVTAMAVVRITGKPPADFFYITIA